MKKLSSSLLACALFLSASVAFASISLHNKDPKSYKILLASSDSCFSGTHTSIGSNTITSLSSTTKYICLDEKKPAYKVEDGKKYEIKDGKVVEKK
jgi:hypothetical protein